MPRLLILHSPTGNVHECVYNIQTPTSPTTMCYTNIKQIRWYIESHNLDEFCALKKKNYVLHFIWFLNIQQLVKLI